jgi:hypothetical protein
MRTRSKFVAAFCAAFVLQAAAEGADYFVNKQGNDANDGASRATSFLTIQRGVDALKPGDTLTIGPGEYFESVQRADLGSPNADTVIRAEIPGTALLRGDVPAPEFKKVEGYRFVYAAKFDQEPKAVMEHSKLHTLLPKANVAELEFDPGSFYYDADSRLLYISNPDLSAPDQCRYTLAVGGECGIKLNSSKHPPTVFSFCARRTSIGISSSPIRSTSTFGFSPIRGSAAQPRTGPIAARIPTSRTSSMSRLTAMTGPTACPCASRGVAWTARSKTCVRAIRSTWPRANTRPRP